MVGVRRLDIVPEKLPLKTQSTVKEAIANMPALRSGLSKEKDTECSENAITEQVKEALIGHTNVDTEIKKSNSFSGHSMNSWTW